MDVTVAAVRDPMLLGELQPGTPFVAHLPAYTDVVFLRATGGCAAPTLPAVVLGARGIAPGECGYMKPGYLVTLPPDTPVTPLEQIEPLALRPKYPTT